MEFSPVCSVLDADSERYLEFYGVFHFVFDEGNRAVDSLFVIRALEYELIVDLKKHVCWRMCFVESGLYINHRLFDNVCRAALNWGVESDAFCALLLKFVAAVYCGDSSSAAHDCFNIAILFCMLNCFIAEFINSGICRKVCVDEIFCFCAGDSKLI